MPTPILSYVATVRRRRISRLAAVIVVLMLTVILALAAGPIWRKWYPEEPRGANVVTRSYVEAARICRGFVSRNEPFSSAGRGLPVVAKELPGYDELERDLRALGFSFVWLGEKGRAEDTIAFCYRERTEPVIAVHIRFDLVVDIGSVDDARCVMRLAGRAEQR